MKIATWNVNSIRVRLPQVLAWLADNAPDVLCVQETKCTDTEFPATAFRDAGYHVAFSGQKTYNGVATVARARVDAVIASLPGGDTTQKRLLAATVGNVRVVNVYVPNGEQVSSDKYRYKLDWLDTFTRYVAEELKRHTDLVVAGDFNVAPEERDVHDPVLWQGRVLFSDKERAAFRELTDTGLVDVFRRFEQPENSFTWWDYRQGAFRRNHGLRIDHILCSPALAAMCRTCRIDTTPRTLERPSDHTPVIAEFGR